MILKNTEKLCLILIRKKDINKTQTTITPTMVTLFLKYVYATLHVYFLWLFEFS